MSTLPYTLHLGDSREILKSLPDNSVDAIVTDPPYGLSKEPDMAEVLRHWLAGDDYTATGGGFMGKTWDSFVPGPAVWRECMRVLKPGGHLLAFFGSRTYDMGTLAIRLAGFEIRDQIMWLYGSGFPKSMDVSKAIDKAAGAEREVIAVGKAVKRMIPGADQDKTGSWIKDNGRTFTPTVTAAATDAAQKWQGWGTALKPAHEPIVVARKPLIGTVAANVLAHGAGALNIDGCRVATDDDLNGGAYSSERKPSSSEWVKSGGTIHNSTGEVFVQPSGRWPANVIHDGSEEVVALFPAQAGAAAPVHRRNGDKFRNAYGAFAGNIDEAGSTFHADKGSAARFFYCAKASRSDRGQGNTHPTVKPTELMAYLVRLVTPPGGIVLDPFMGSGSTGKAAMREGFRFIGIDLTPEYVDIARARIEHEISKQNKTHQQIDLFQSA